MYRGDIFEPVPDLSTEIFFLQAQTRPTSSTPTGWPQTPNLRRYFSVSKVLIRLLQSHLTGLHSSSQAYRPSGSQARGGQEAETGVQRQAVGPAGGGVQGGQVLVGLQEAGAVQEPPPDGGPDQDLVPEQKDQVEEADDCEVGEGDIVDGDDMFDVQTEAGPEAGTPPSPRPSALPGARPAPPPPPPPPSRPSRPAPPPGEDPGDPALGHEHIIPL